MNTSFSPKYVEGSTDGRTRRCSLVAVTDTPEKALPLTQLLFDGSPFRLPEAPELKLVKPTS